MIRSIPRAGTWDSFKMNLTHDESLKTFDDVARHLVLEEDRLQSEKLVHESYVADTGRQRQKRNRGGKKGSFKSHLPEPPKKKGKRANGAPKKQASQKGTASSSGKKCKSKVICYSCKKSGHIARDCPNNQVLVSYEYSEKCFVASCNNQLLVSYEQYEKYFVSSCMLTEYSPLWTVDSAATEHIARDRMCYVDFRRIPRGSKKIYMGNNTSVEVLGIGTCKLNLSSSKTLLLHDVLYAPEIRQNLVSVPSLLRFNYKLVF